MNKSHNTVIWPKTFENNDISGISDAELCADALVSWGHCMSGNKPHPNFGEVMVKIGDKIGCSMLPEDLRVFAKRFYQ